jgi:hypothetical protein
MSAPVQPATSIHGAHPGLALEVAEGTQRLGGETEVALHGVAEVGRGVGVGCEEQRRGRDGDQRGETGDADQASPVILAR